MKYFTDVPAQHEMMCELFQAMKELGGSGSLHEIDEKTIELLNISPEILERCV